MNEPRVLRTLAAPLGVAVLFLLLTPKLCQRALVQAAAQRPLVPAPAKGSKSGLIIDSSTPAPVRASDLRYPPGLDTSRIEYLVEIDQAFATPSTMAVTASAPIADELLRRQYVEKHADGTIVPTRDGLMNVSGATESSDGWMVPVAQRKFMTVAKIEDAGDGRFDVSVFWQWQPTAVGASLLPHPQDHWLKAEFAGGEGHWVLARWIREPDHELR